MKVFTSSVQIVSIYYVSTHKSRVDLEVLEMMVEGRSFKAVGDSAGSLHTIGHAWGATGEHSNLGNKDVLLLKVVEELVEVWATKVGDGSQSGEQALARQPLEVALTDVLRGEEREGEKKSRYIIVMKIVLTSIVVRRSNLSKNCVTKIWTSSWLVLSFSSASRMISVNHSYCF